MRNCFKYKSACKLGVLLLLILPLIPCMTGCTQEKNYRQVPDRLWRHLTPEQKQLIVDESFQAEMKKIEDN